MHVSVRTSPVKAQKSPTRTLDQIAGRLEPPFPLRLLGFGLVYAWSTCLWNTAAVVAAGEPAVHTSAV